MKWIAGVVLGLAVGASASATEMTRERACELASLETADGVQDYLEKGVDERGYAISLQKNIYDEQENFVLSADNAILLAHLVYETYGSYTSPALTVKFTHDCKKKDWDFRPLMTVLERVKQSSGSKNSK
ncbi:hypothetical protein [Castellaniella sp.]|uniref:hypothetical protein n=1 Tax=Castellaniella sp. TaxID=1955812 RepID=UPI002B0025B8|nr:hypothetical protein [Castellaniella sp.]